MTGPYGCTCVVVRGLGRAADGVDDRPERAVERVERSLYGSVGALDLDHLDHPLHRALVALFDEALPDVTVFQSRGIRDSLETDRPFSATTFSC